MNIGVLLQEEQVPEHTEVGFTRDWSRVRCMDRNVDLEMLQALEAGIRNTLKEVPGSFERFQESFSNSLQVTEPKGCLAESIKAELGRLMRLYVESVRPPKKEQRLSGRGVLQGQMRQAFKRAGVLDLMKKRFAISEYTEEKGNPLTIDFGYKPDGVVRMFQAVSLLSEVDLAISLSFSSARLEEGVKRLTQADLELTAIVEPLDQSVDAQASDRYAFAHSAMEKSHIRVLTSEALPRLAAVAKHELAN